MPNRKKFAVKNCEVTVYANGEAVPVVIRIARFFHIPWPQAACVLEEFIGTLALRTLPRGISALHSPCLLQTLRPLQLPWTKATACKCSASPHAAGPTAAPLPADYITMMGRSPYATKEPIVKPQ